MLTHLATGNSGVQGCANVLSLGVGVTAASQAGPLSPSLTTKDGAFMEIAGLRLDPFRREVYRDGRYVALTRKQFAVLEVSSLPKAVSSAPKSS